MADYCIKCTISDLPIGLKWQANEQHREDEKFEMWHTENVVLFPIISSENMKKLNAIMRLDGELKDNPNLSILEQKDKISKWFKPRKPINKLSFDKNTLAQLQEIDIDTNQFISDYKSTIFITSEYSNWAYPIFCKFHADGKFFDIEENEYTKILEKVFEMPIMDIIYTLYYEENQYHLTKNDFENPLDEQSNVKMNRHVLYSSYLSVIKRSVWDKIQKAYENFVKPIPQTEIDKKLKKLDIFHNVNNDYEFYAHKGEYFDPSTGYLRDIHRGHPLSILGVDTLFRETIEMFKQGHLIDLIVQVKRFDRFLCDGMRCLTPVKKIPQCYDGQETQKYVNLMKDFLNEDLANS